MDMSTVLGSNSFSVFDFTVIGISLGVALFCGLYHVAFTSHSAEDYLVGGRVMSTAPVAISTAMLYISALAIIDSPADIYYNGIESFMASVVTAAIVPFSAFLFVPMFHKMKLTSIHQYIGHRFDSTVLRCITSLTFILQQAFLICVMLILVSKALETYFQIPILTSIIGIGTFTAVNTTLGGFKATVWMQVLHFVCISAFLTLLAAIGFTKAGGFVRAFELAAEQGRLELFIFKIDPFMKHNFYNFLFGYGFMTLMEMATCQPIVQRYSSLPTRKDALKSVFMGIPLHIVPSFLCLLIGIFLQAIYNGSDPLNTGQIKAQQDIIPYFIETKAFFIPGITGAFIASVGGGMIR
ncbi:Sodium-dependent multivitamin transporter [Orchesella cincta]|uniref:Sodium-dependent multivitamin transporter n=1 Tax=Orchesella cincta TaxID=48709 RepID=A0A1D2MT32_ORCCI|nr:Sodium-dependent multivitamin transporter [Orchesella cincta]